jgi:hypothetical protein
MKTPKTLEAAAQQIINMSISSTRETARLILKEGITIGILPLNDFGTPAEFSGI